MASQSGNTDSSGYPTSPYVSGVHWYFAIVNIGTVHVFILIFHTIEDTTVKARSPLDLVPGIPTLGSFERNSLIKYVCSDHSIPKHKNIPLRDNVEHYEIKKNPRVDLSFTDAKALLHTTKHMPDSSNTYILQNWRFDYALIALR